MRIVRIALLVAFALALTVTAGPAQAGEHRLGFGFHYWKTLDQLKDQGVSNASDIDESGLSELFSYQYIPRGMLKIEVDIEHFKDGFGGATEAAYSPQVFLLVGRGIYAGVGVGATYSKTFDSSWSDPYYAAKAGIEWPLLPRMDLDLNANYRFDAWSELENVDTGTLTFGAVLRIAL